MRTLRVIERERTEINPVDMWFTQYLLMRAACIGSVWFDDIDYPRSDDSIDSGRRERRSLGVPENEVKIFAHGLWCRQFSQNRKILQRLKGTSENS